MCRVRTKPIGGGKAPWSWWGAGGAVGGGIGPGGGGGGGGRGGGPGVGRWGGPAAGPGGGVQGGRRAGRGTMGRPGGGSGGGVAGLGSPHRLMLRLGPITTWDIGPNAETRDRPPAARTHVPRAAIESIDLIPAWRRGQG